MKHFALVLRNWDESRYGPLDESKIEAKMLFGKSVKGAYAQTGKAGHYKVRDWQGKSRSQETKEHDGKQALFNEAALANKKKAIAAAFDEEQQERRSSAATAKGPQNMDRFHPCFGPWLWPSPRSRPTSRSGLWPGPTASRGRRRCPSS